MPPRPLLPLHLPLQPIPYRLFHLSACHRLRSPSHPTPFPSPSQEAVDDYYSLLLSSSTPTPSPTSTAHETTNPARAPKSTKPSSSSLLPPPSTATPAHKPPSQPIEVSDDGPNNRVLFSTPLQGPSARMRGLARAERGLERPPEPDNCCMSGCVNCVWDTFREEVEEWAAARKRQSRQDSSRASGASGASRRGTGGIGEERGRVKGMDDDGGVAGGVGDLDEPGGLSGYEGVDLADEEMFWGVPLGIREFMNTEKRLRERRATEKYV